MDSGRVLAGRYRLVEPLGSGGMGTVWLAVDEVLHRQVAVKEVSPPADVSEPERDMLRERTMREARTAARLSHPNVVTIYDVVEDGNQPWIVMELLQARTLRDIVREDGPMTPRQTARVALQVLAALRAAHVLGITHRDVKPGNVMIDSAGRAVLADFGIARALDSPTITRSGMLVGSPSYIAPERARGERGGPESDLWSLGATLYTAVEGRPPYDRAGALATLMAVVTEDPDPPMRSGHLWPVISGLLRRDQAQRLGSAAAELMLRRIAEANEAPATAPLPITAGRVDPGGWAGAAPAPLGESPERIQATRPFEPHAVQPAAPVPLAETPAPAHTPEAPAPTPALVHSPEAPTPTHTPEAPTPADTPEAPTPADTPEAPTPADTPEAPTPADRLEAPTPADRLEAPTVAHSPEASPGTDEGDTEATPPAEFPVLITSLGHPGTDEREHRAEPAGEAVPAPFSASLLATQPAPASANIVEPPLAPPPMAPPPQPQEGRASWWRRQLTWVIAAAVALVAIAVALLVLNAGGHHAAAHAPRRGHAAATPAAAKSAVPAPRPSSAGSATPSPPPRPTAAGQAPVAAGYHTYHDPTGFSIAVPDGWVVSHQGVDVYISPPSGAAFLLIDQSSHPKPDPLADWRQQEANRIGTYPGYDRIRLEAISYPQAEKAADWEFTYNRQGVPTHVLNRNVLANATHAYALYWSTPESQWSQSFPIFEVFARTFQPAP
jgi:hypothetical protein